MGFLEYKLARGLEFRLKLNPNVQAQPLAILNVEATQNPKKNPNPVNRFKVSATLVLRVLGFLEVRVGERVGVKLNAKAQAKLLANPFSYVNVGLAKSLVVRLLHL